MKHARTLVGALCCTVLFSLIGFGCGGEAEVEEAPIDYGNLPPVDLVNQLASTGDLENLQKVLTKAPELLNAPSPSRGTLLHSAAANGQDDVVRFLLEQGLSPQIPDDQAQYPSETALNNGHSSTAKILNEAGQSAAPAQ
jgi:ankyrin repeat protein